MAHSDWIADIPQQFVGKKNIEIFIKAFSKQLEELEHVYEDLKFKTTLENATGQSLRYIGDILSTSTMEAQAILKAVNREITDETYRKVLQYKALKNNCDCTYADIMESLDMLWDASMVKYVEDPDKPATIYIALLEAHVDSIDPAVGRVLAIKPAGIAMIYNVNYVAGANISGVEKANVPEIVMVPQWVKNNIAVVSGVKLQGDISINENVTASIISLKNFWMLDGTYLLDGSKMLDAEKIEEVL